MLDIILDKIKETVKSREFAITLIYLCLVGGLIYRMFYLQIIHGDEYQKKYQSSKVHVRSLKATRGNIYDTNGKLLAENVLTYSVVFQDYGKLTEGTKINDMIANMIRLIEKNGDSVDVDFGLKMTDDGKIEYAVTGNKKKRFLKDAYSNEKLTDKELSVSAEEVYRFLNDAKNTHSPKFNVDGKKYSKEMRFKITAVRFAMYANRYSTYKQLTIASDVNEKTVAAIEENSADLTGVSIMEDTQRLYNKKYSYSLAHILGYTGSIGTTDPKKLGLDKKKYTTDDQIGKSGIEKQYEDYLHGTMGKEEVTLNNKKAITNIKVTKEPTAGNDVYLTIDADLQQASYKLLEEHLAAILLTKIEGSGDFSIKMTDVYNAILNNIIDVMKFKKSNASELEKSVYAKYKAERSVVFNRLDTIVAYNSKQTYKSLDKDYQDYTNYIYKLLGSKSILLKDKIDHNDKKYIAYTKDKISLSEFLQYAISKEWMDRSKFSDSKGYYSSEEIYTKLLTKIKKLLEDDSTFNKMVYKSLVNSGKISGREICLLLFDQGVLKYSKDVDKLKSGVLSPSSFIRAKIKKLQITPGQLGLNGCTGSIVVTDVNTGEVRAMVSYPGYDNNKLANKIDPDYYAMLSTSTASPLINRPVQQRTAPGSTYKLMTSVAGLTEGVINTSTTFNCTGRFTLLGGKKGPQCWKHSGHGILNVVGGIKNSCNVFFYNVGWRLSQVNGRYNSNYGLKRLAKYAKMFGFDAPSGVGFGEYQPMISVQDSVRSAIGQGNNNYTPTQINRYTDAIANEGTVYDLSILSQVKTPDGKVVKKGKSKVHNKITTVADSTWDAVHKGAYQVVNDGSLKSLFADANVTVAGKTGTAQENKKKPDHALFTSFAPYDDPEKAVTVVMPNGYTSSYAAEIAGKVYKYMYNKSARKELLKEGVGKPKASATHD